MKALLSEGPVVWDGLLWTKGSEIIALNSDFRMPMFATYSDDTKRALVFGRYEAAALGATAVEPQHLLLGILRLSSEAVQRLARSLNVTIEDIRRAIPMQTLVPERVTAAYELELSESAEKVMKYAAHEAEAMLLDYVGPEHIILGLLRVSGSDAERSLVSSGVRLEEARKSLENEGQ